MTSWRSLPRSSTAGWRSDATEASWRLPRVGPIPKPLTISCRRRSTTSWRRATLAEVSIIHDAISLLEEHAQSEREGIDTAMDEFIRLKDGWTAGDTPAPMIPRDGESTAVQPGRRPIPISRGAWRKKSNRFERPRTSADGRSAS